MAPEHSIHSSLRVSNQVGDDDVHRFANQHQGGNLASDGRDHMTRSMRLVGHAHDPRFLGQPKGGHREGRRRTRKALDDDVGVLVEQLPLSPETRQRERRPRVPGGAGLDEIQRASRHATNDSCRRSG
jgi:hypothetical protein